MAKLGVITDGISRDLEHALQVAIEADLEYANFAQSHRIAGVRDQDVWTYILRMATSQVDGAGWYRLRH